MAEFLKETEGVFQVLAISGRLEPNDGTTLRSELDRLAAEPSIHGVVVDLSRLDYMASAGFRELFLVGRKLARRNCRLAVSGLHGEVDRIFRLARFETAYPIYPTREEAINALRKNPE